FGVLADVEHGHVAAVDEPRGELRRGDEDLRWQGGRRHELLPAGLQMVGSRLLHNRGVVLGRDTGTGGCYNSPMGSTTPAPARQTSRADPELPAPFAWVGLHVGCALPGGRALFTTRRGGASAPPHDSLNLGVLTADDPAVVSHNRDRLAAITRIPRARTLQGMQVHGSHVRRVRELPDPAAPLAEADGQATALEDVAAVVLAADCLPIALVAREAVAIVHAGWRGLAG